MCPASCCLQYDDRGLGTNPLQLTCSFDALEKVFLVPVTLLVIHIGIGSGTGGEVCVCVCVLLLHCNAS